jgi:hypothetical protein
MRVLSAVALFLLSVVSLPAFADDTGWAEAAKDDGVVVYTRQKAGASLHEMKAVGIIDAPPLKVWGAIRDYDNYKKTMPYTSQSQVVSKEEDGKVIYFYSVVSAPLVSDRDYLIRIKDESDWQDGKGYLKTTWTVSDKGPAPRSGIVRVQVNDGSWLLEPRDDGKKTLATYYVYTDPGGSLPRFIANKANSTAVPNVFKAIKKTVSH